MSTSVKLSKVYKRFGNVEVIHGIDLTVDPGEFTVFVGPSGCGKSTLLRMIAGLEPISGGELLIDDELMNEVPPAKRGIAMVFQSYALYPHMTVYKNLAFGLETAGMRKSEIEDRVRRAAEILQIGQLLDRKPKQLSGGQRQRVAIGRAIVREPRIFLFDEPLSNLDAELRVQMRVEIAKLHRDLGNTMIYVTHDQVEAMTMADKIVVLNGGRIEQVGSPLELYRNPRNLFVAGFIGSPRMNFIDGAEAKKLGAATIGIRPEHLRLSATEGLWKGRVDVAEHLGSDTFLHIEMDGIGPLTARIGGEFPVRVGDTVHVTPEDGKIHRFDEKGLAL